MSTVQPDSQGTPVAHVWDMCSWPLLPVVDPSQSWRLSTIVSGGLFSGIFTGCQLLMTLVSNFSQVSKDVSLEDFWRNPAAAASPMIKCQQRGWNLRRCCTANHDFVPSQTFDQQASTFQLESTIACHILSPEQCSVTRQNRKAPPLRSRYYWMAWEHLYYLSTGAAKGLQANAIWQCNARERKLDP